MFCLATVFALANKSQAAVLKPFFHNVITEPLKLALQVELAEWKRAYGVELNNLMRTRVNEMTEYMANQTKTLGKPVKDLDDVRMAMSGLTSVKENYIRLDEEMTPIEVSL